MIEKSGRWALSSIRCVVFISLAMAPTDTVAQAEIHDRRPFLAPDVQTTDDPVRIPRKPAENEDMQTVFRGGRFLDVVNGRVRPATVVVAGNRIKSVLPPAATDWREDAKVIDISGKTIMPGLIDMHTHVTYPDRPGTPLDEHASEGSGALRGQRNLRYFLESGVTSVRDLNGVANAPFLLSAWSAKNAIPAPRIFTSGYIITGTGGHAMERPMSPLRSGAFAKEADGADAWRLAVRRAFKQGASVIKIASHFSADEVAAAVDEAHLLGLKITCDCETVYTKMAVEAGVDMIEHPLPQLDGTIRLMAKEGITVIPTLQVYHDLLAKRGGYYGSTSRRFTLTSEGMLDLFRRMKNAGITMGVGTDIIGQAAKDLPHNYIAELKLFVEGGYSIIEVLQAATITNATLLDMDDKLGSLAPGKLADLIVIDGRPDENLDDLEKIDYVMKDGRLLVRSGLLFTPRLDKDPTE